MKSMYKVLDQSSTVVFSYLLIVTPMSPIGWAFCLGSFMGQCAESADF